MSPIELQTHEADCARLCVDFANSIDARDYPRFLDLFTEDGTLDRLGEAFRGRQAIERFLTARPADAITRHLCTNIRIDLRSDTEATGKSYALFFQGIAEPNTQLPLRSSAPSVVEYQDLFERTSAGWRIRERKIMMIFKS